MEPAYFVPYLTSEFVDNPRTGSPPNQPRETSHVAEVTQDSRRAHSGPHTRCCLDSHQRRSTWLPLRSCVPWCGWLGSRRLGWRRPLGRWLGRWRLGQRRLGGRRLGRRLLLLCSSASSASAAVLLLWWLEQRRLGWRRLGWLVICESKKLAAVEIASIVGNAPSARGQGSQAAYLTKQMGPHGAAPSPEAQCS
jgi:hypothetical protein